jgi:hypothetical protein
VGLPEYREVAIASQVAAREVRAAYREAALAGMAVGVRVVDAAHEDLRPVGVVALAAHALAGHVSGFHAAAGVATGERAVLPRADGVRAERAGLGRGEVDERVYERGLAEAVRDAERLGRRDHASLLAST